MVEDGVPCSTKSSHKRIPRISWRLQRSLACKLRGLKAEGMEWNAIPFDFPRVFVALDLVSRAAIDRRWKVEGISFSSSFGFSI